MLVKKRRNLKIFFSFMNKINHIFLVRAESLLIVIEITQLIIQQKHYLFIFECIILISHLKEKVKKYVPITL